MCSARFDLVGVHNCVAIVNIGQVINFVEFDTFDTWMVRIIPCLHE